MYDSSLVVRLQEEALEKIDIYERSIAKAVQDKIRSMPIARHDTLSRLELDTLIGLAIGEGLDVIAKRQGVSPKTVGTRRERVQLKLGLHSMRELVLYAFKIAMERK